MQVPRPPDFNLTRANIRVSIWEHIHDVDDVRWKMVVTDLTNRGPTVDRRVLMMEEHVDEEMWQISGLYQGVAEGHAWIEGRKKHWMAVNLEIQRRRLETLRKREQYKRAKATRDRKKRMKGNVYDRSDD